MAEEFQESDIVFADTVDFDNQDRSRNFSSHDYRESKSGNNNNNNKAAAVGKRPAASSLPVEIPWIRRRVDAMESDLIGDGEMEPPHVITGRRIAGKMMSFSVCGGSKGRNLSEVRNSILRMTGFLEA